MTRETNEKGQERKGKGCVTKRGGPRKTVERDEWDEEFPTTESFTRTISSSS